MIRIPTPLSQNENLFRQMYIKNPGLQLERPRTLDELNEATHMLPEHSRIAYRGQTLSVGRPHMDESAFQEHCDVSANLHERFCPGFFHMHDFFEVIYVLNGSCSNVIDGKERLLVPGDICIIAPGTTHAISAFHEEDVILNLLMRSSTFQQTFFSSFNGRDTLSTFFSHALFASEKGSWLLFRTNEDGELLSLAERIYTEVQEPQRYSGPISNALLTLFFLILLRRHEKDLVVQNPTGRETDSNIVFILNYISANYNHLTLTDLASFFSYSERQMARLLKDYTGQTFTGLIQEIRLQKACLLLSDPRIPIPEIIDRIGYSNASHFYTLFRKKYGLTPAEYRKADQNSTILQ